MSPAEALAGSARILAEAIGTLSRSMEEFSAAADRLNPKNNENGNENENGND